MKKKLSLALTVLIVVLSVLTAVPASANVTVSTAPLGDTALYLSGDTDFDGDVTIMDVTMIQYVFVNMRTDPYGAIAKVGNVNPDDDFNITDATFIQRWLVGIPPYKSVRVKTFNIEMALPELKSYSAPKPTTSVTDTGIKISWDKVSGAQMYRVFKSKYIDGKQIWESIGDTSDLSFTDTTVYIGQTYTYSIRCVTTDHQMHVSPFSASNTIKCTQTPIRHYEPPTQAPTVAPSQVPTQEPTQAPTEKPTEPMPAGGTLTPSVYVYDGKIYASWNAVSGATKYVVKFYKPQWDGTENVLETRTVTTNSVVSNYQFTARAGYTYTGETFQTTVIAYKNSTALTTPKDVSTTTVQKQISSQSLDRYRTVFTLLADINFCNNCGQLIPTGYQTGLTNRLDPEAADAGLQAYHTHVTGCGAWSYRCWSVNWPSGLMNTVLEDPANYYIAYSIVDTNFDFNYYPVTTTAPSITSIKKVSYTDTLHLQQLNNDANDRGGTNDPLPMMQADGALEITFKPTDSSIKYYYIWVKTTDAKSVNKLTQLHEPGDQHGTKGNMQYMYNQYGGKWTYDENYNDWAVVGCLIIDSANSKYTSFSYLTNTAMGRIANKTVYTSDFSNLTFTLNNYYGNEYNSVYDWNTLDNNTKYEFAIQPRTVRRGSDIMYSDTVPAAPKGQSKTFTWTGRDYEYYTENNAYLLGATTRGTATKSKTIEVYADQKNLDYKTWGNFRLWSMGHDDRTGKDYIELGTVPYGNQYRIPVRCDWEHEGGIHAWKGTNGHGNYELSTRIAVFLHASDKKERTDTFTISSEGLYCRTNMYDVWSKRNQYGKNLTVSVHNVPIYDPLCYEYRLDGKEYYYYDYEDANFWSKYRPANYVNMQPVAGAIRKRTDEHLWETEIEDYYSYLKK